MMRERMLILMGATLSVGLSVALSVVPSIAWADGAVLRPVDLGAGEARIAARISDERARDPAMFETVAAINVYRPEGVRRTRAQRPTAVGVMYRRLGPRARWALVDLAVFHAPPRAGVDDGAWRALQIGLIDAIGAAGDAELAPVLRGTFEQSAVVELQGTAAVGLGRLGAAELPLLLAHAHPGDPRFIPSLRGLGASHRPQAATALSALLDGATDETQAAEIADALAEAASSWAWGTGKVGSLTEEKEVRATAAGAIVRNYPRFSGAASEHLELAVRRVAHPEFVATAIATARSRVSAEGAARLDHLAGVVKRR